MISVAQILDATAHVTGVPVSALKSPCRRREWARPRQIAMYLAKELTLQSLPQIARAVGRDHTTVLYAARRVPEIAAKDVSFACLLSTVREHVMEV